MNGAASEMGPPYMNRLVRFSVASSGKRGKCDERQTGDEKMKRIFIPFVIILVACASSCNKNYTGRYYIIDGEYNITYINAIKNTDRDDKEKTLIKIDTMTGHYWSYRKTVFIYSGNDSTKTTTINHWEPLNDLLLGIPKSP